MPSFVICRSGLSCPRNFSLCDLMLRRKRFWTRIFNAFFNSKKIWWCLLISAISPWKDLLIRREVSSKNINKREQIQLNRIGPDHLRNNWIQPLWVNPWLKALLFIRSGRNVVSGSQIPLSICMWKRNRRKRTIFWKWENKNRIISKMLHFFNSFQLMNHCYLLIWSSLQPSDEGKKKTLWSSYMDEKYDIQGAQSYTVILAEPAVQLGLFNWKCL